MLIIPAGSDEYISYASRLFLLQSKGLGFGAGGAGQTYQNFNWASGIEVGGDPTTPNPNIPTGITCAVSDGLLVYPDTFFMGGIRASDDDAHRAISMVTDFASDYKAVFFNTDTEAAVNVYNGGAAPLADWPVYATINQTFWVAAFNAPAWDTLHRFTKDGVLAGSLVVTPGNNISSIISYEPTTELIYAFPDGLAGEEDLLFIINPATNTIGTYVLGSHLGVPTGGDVLACPGYLFITGLESQLGLQIFNIRSVPGFASVGNLDLDTVGWSGGFGYAANTGKVYFGDTLGNVHEVNPANGLVDYTYPVFGQTIRAITYDPNQGRLLFIGDFGNVWTIDPLTRSVICVQASGLGGVAAYSGASIDANLGKTLANHVSLNSTTSLWV